MALDWKKMLSDLTSVVGQMGVDALVTELESLSKSANEPWQRAVLGLIGNAVEKNGPAGIDLAVQAIKDALEGDKDPEVDWSDLEGASDLLAIMQNKEADEKSALEDFMGQASHSLGIILGGLIRGLIA